MLILGCDRVQLKAMESSQKYKEGRFIMEQALVLDEEQDRVANHW